MKIDREKLKKTIIIILLALTFIFLSDTLGFRKTMLGAIILFSIFAIYRFWNQRGLVMYQLRRSEKIIFGKSLDKDQWRKDELKNRKIKIVWKRKNGKKIKNKQ